MPPEAKVAIYESMPGFVEEYRAQLEQSGHTVVGVATNIHEGADLTPRLEELGVQVIFLAGNFYPHSEYDYDSEGRRMARGIKSSHPQIQIVGVPDSGRIEGTDFNVSKTRMLADRVHLGEFVREI